jgi:hypothetical protein
MVFSYERQLCHFLDGEARGPASTKTFPFQRLDLVPPTGDLFTVISVSAQLLQRMFRMLSRLQGEREQRVPGSDADELSALDEVSHWTCPDHPPKVLSPNLVAGLRT